MGSEMFLLPQNCTHLGDVQAMVGEQPVSAHIWHEISHKLIVPSKQPFGFVFSTSERLKHDLKQFVLG